LERRLELNYVTIGYSGLGSLPPTGRKKLGTRGAISQDLSAPGKVTPLLEKKNPGPAKGISPISP